MNKPIKSTFEIDHEARERIANVWRHRVELLGVSIPTANEVAAAAETTAWQVRKMLGGLVAYGCSEEDL